ncbi:hypothetical protein HF521_012102 [Silurus meridionalis]|uniref:Pellino RING domain-containing protein n=1 Tax=Silurus meridionalis TaxID=175797 RepID=A0A8T0AG67_SILME|nr:hypothetical protein HF521_012102 [Silurus meridionalis]
MWREISVCGNVYTLRETRSGPIRGQLAQGESSALQDGSLVDLCGATLLWRTAEATRSHSLEERQPWAYLTCGHVHGRHDWGQKPEHCREHEGGPSTGGRRECPLCRSLGPYVPLWLGCEPAFYVDAGAPTHAFVPCGHVCSERTAKYWAETSLPHGTHAFQPICPFCSTPLTGTPGFTRLIFQGPVD